MAKIVCGFGNVHNRATYLKGEAIHLLLVIDVAKERERCCFVSPKST